MSTLPNLSRLTLKGFKTVAYMSQETLCFTSNVYLDGKLIGEAANEGCGGCTFVHFVSPEANASAQAFAKTVNPSDVEGWGFLSEAGFTFDCLVDVVVGFEQTKKDKARLIKKTRKVALEKTSFISEDCKPGQIRKFATLTTDLNRASRLASASAFPGFKCFVSDMTDEQIISHFSL